MESALEKQVGGNHYKQLPYQPVKFIAELGLSYTQGCAIKYISRHRFKGKAEDLDKAIHYCALSMELQDFRRVALTDANLVELIQNYCTANSLNAYEERAIIYIASFHFSDAIRWLTGLKQNEYLNQNTK